MKATTNKRIMNVIKSVTVELDPADGVVINQLRNKVMNVIQSRTACDEYDHIPYIKRKRIEKPRQEILTDQDLDNIAQLLTNLTCRFGSLIESNVFSPLKDEDFFNLKDEDFFNT